MRLIIKDRGQGKTTQMIYTSEATGYPIAVQTVAQINNIKQKAKDLNIKIPEPLLLSEIKECMFVDNMILIDEGNNIIKEALESYLGCSIAGITVSKNDNIIFSKSPKNKGIEEGIISIDEL